MPQKLLLISAIAIVSLAAANDEAAARVRVEAFAGQPFGVGKATVSVVRGEPTIPLADERFTAQTSDGRVLYPVLKKAPVRRLLRQLLEIDAPSSVTVYFLFRGDAPFELDLYAPVAQRVAVSPQASPRRHQELLNDWFDEYRRRWQDLRRDPQFPPLVENFVAANMARRLGKDLPPPGRSLFSWAAPQVSVWDAIFTGETYQLEYDRKLLLGRSLDAAPAAALPRSIPWPRPDIAEDDIRDVAVESIARHVPQECFYVRFGAFLNYLWFRDLEAKWDGDLKNMLLRRGVENAADQRIEQQLSLKQSALAKVLGPQVIEDVAFIGLDPYLAQGGAVGILFQAKNNFLLQRDLTAQRRRALERFDDASETTVELANREVSLISNPSAEVRSYYLQDGDFHLVTASRRLMERFIQAGEGDRPLAENAGFLLAREALPPDRDDAFFVHVSSAFVKQLCSPAVWIENQRRLRSVREMTLLRLARMAAQAEGVDAQSIEDLIAADLLPRGFGQRPDESLIIEENGLMTDSLRGRPGWFTPIADMPAESASEAEAEAYRRFSERFLQEVGRTPPLSLAAARTRLPNGGETVALNLLAAPCTDLKLGKFAEALGPASTEQIAPTSDDLAHFELLLDTQFTLLGQENELHHLFGALQDFKSPLVVEQGTVAPDAPATEFVRGYIGAWPRPGLLALFTGRNPLVGPQPDRLENDIFLAGRDDLFLLSFKPELVDKVLPQLQRVEAQRPAQVRVLIRDLTGSDLSELVNAVGYMRSREASVAATRLMNTMANQLHVPRPLALETVEEFADGRLICSLGGDYQLVEPPGGVAVWISSALSDENRFMLSEVPDGFELPLLQWFRGLRGDMQVGDEAIQAHVEIDLDESAIPWQIEMPERLVPPASAE